MSITQISDFTLRHMIENDKRDKEFQQKQIDRIRQLETELADKEKQLAEAYDYAVTLLMGIVKNHYPPIEGFGPFPKPDILGVLTQIDNAYTGVRDQLYEARAEVEREELRKQLAEARADAEYWKSECNALQRMVHDARAEIDGLTLMATNASMEPARRLIQKNKELHAVIEQMREALRLALPEARSTHVEQTILAALAAERGE